MSAKMSSAYKAAHILVERVRVLKALCQESAGNAILAVTMNGFSPKSGFETVSNKATIAELAPPRRFDDSCDSNRVYGPMCLFYRRCRNQIVQMRVCLALLGFRGHGSVRAEDAWSGPGYG